MKRILLLPLLILSIYLKAENPPEPQNAPGDGGAGGDGFGTVTSPIDMYVYMLAIIAVFMIFFYVKKSKKGEVIGNKGKNIKKLRGKYGKIIIKEI